MAAAAAERTFRTPELLEAILLQDIPMLQLFTIQRTCRAFLETINGSVLLKRIMFLEPELQSAERSNENYSYLGDRLNPLFSRTLFPTRHSKDDAVFLTHSTGSERFEDGIELHFIILSERSQTVSQLERQALSSETQSWRRMLVLSFSHAQGLVSNLHTRSRPLSNPIMEKYFSRRHLSKAVTMGEMFEGLMGAHEMFLKAKAKGWRKASDYILEHGGKMDDVMQLVFENEK